MAKKNIMQIHDIADGVEVRLQRSVSKAFKNASDRVSLSDVTVRMQLGDQKGAINLMMAEIEDAMSPTATILSDTSLRGRRLGVKLVNEAGE